MPDFHFAISILESDPEILQRFAQLCNKMKLDEQERAQIFNDFKSTILPAVKGAREVSELGSTIDFHKRISVGDCGVIVRFASDRPAFFRRIIKRLIG